MNDASTTRDAVVDAFNVTGTVVGAGTSAYAFVCENINNANTLTLNLSNSVCKALQGTPLDIAVASISTTTNNSVVNSYLSTFDGADYDVYQTGSNQLNLGGSVIVNNKTFGTVTYRATMASGTGVFADSIKIQNTWFTEDDIGGSDSHITDSSIELTQTGGLGDNNFWVWMGHNIGPRMMFGWQNINDTRELYQIIDTNGFNMYVVDEQGGSFQDGFKLKQSNTEDYFGVNIRKNSTYSPGFSDFYIDTNGVEILKDLMVNGEIEDHVIKSFTVDCPYDSVVGQWYRPIIYSPARDLIILRIIFQEVIALGSTSGTTTLYFMDEGSSSMYLGSIVADGSGPLELTFEALQAYPYRVNAGDGTVGFSFFADVQDLTDGLLRVTVEYIDY